MAAVHPLSTFGYHGLTIATPPIVQHQDDASTQYAEVDQVKSLIKDFLEKINFDRSTPFTKDKVLEETVWNYFTALNLGERTTKSIQKRLKLAVTLTHQAYTGLPFEIKIAVAIQAVYMFLLDDVAEGLMEDLQSFGQNFTLNKGHNNALLNGFDGHLRSLSQYYGPFCHSAIIKSLFDYINGRIIEHKMEQAKFSFPSTSKLMPMYLRTKVGGAEILVHLLWPQCMFPEDKYVMTYFPAIQELVLFIDFTNDILSYYKEFILDHEKGNFVANFAETHNIRQIDVLGHLTGYTPAVLNSVYQMFQDKPDLLQSVQTLATGWIMSCTAHRRYHLVELFEDEQYLPPYDEDA